MARIRPSSRTPKDFKQFVAELDQGGKRYSNLALEVVQNYAENPEQSDKWGPSETMNRMKTEFPEAYEYLVHMIARRDSSAEAKL